MEKQSAKILVVDDDRVFGERLVKSLKRRGYEAVAVENAENALLAMHAVPSPQAAVIDLQLGRDSGLQLAHQLHKRAPQLRILILTGYGSIATAVEAMRLGAIDYLSKPADADDILHSLFGEMGGDNYKTKGTLPDTPSLGRVEWEHLQRVLHDCEGNISETARRLGIERRTLQRKLKKYPPLI